MYLSHEPVHFLFYILFEQYVWFFSSHLFIFLKKKFSWDNFLSHLLRHSGLMVSVLDSGSSSLGSSLAEIIVSRVLSKQFPLSLTVPGYQELTGLAHPIFSQF